MKTTTQENKLIAEFMGYNYPGDFNLDELMYRSSWDWLMPVVEKIESLGNGVTIYKKGCHVNDIGIFSTNGFNHSSKIEQTWKACVEFIKWYNGQNK